MLYPYISVIDGFKFTSFLDPRENDSFLIEGCLTRNRQTTLTVTI